MQVLLHEFGHVLGLGHVSQKNDLMSTQISGGKKILISRPKSTS
jgi:predicted Zn-dependent protease